MKILFLVNSFCVCGGIRIIFEFSKRLAEQEHEIYLVYQIGTNIPWYDFNDNVKIVQYHEAINNGLFNKVDIVIGTFWTTWYDLCKINTKARKIGFMQMQESYFYSTINEKQMVKASYDLPLEIITISKWMQKYLKESHNKNSFLVRYGLDFDLFYPDPDPKYLKEKRKFTVLIEGSPTNIHKNNTIVYEALKRLNIDLWSLSTEKETRAIKNYCLPDKNDIRKIYSAVDMVVKPSLYEGLSAIGVEAGATSTTFSGSNIPGISEYITHEYNGLLFNPYSKQSICDSVDRIMQEPELANQLKINNMKLVHKNFNWNKCISLLENIFTGIGNTESEW